MLRIYDKKHNAIGYMQNYKDLKIECDVGSGDKTLYFTYMGDEAFGDESLEPECYVETREDEYVIKEKNPSSDGFPQYVAILNLEDLRKKRFDTFSVKEATIEEAARLALAGTGWIVGECTVKKRRNAGMTNVTPKDAIDKLCTAFMCEKIFDTKKKTVSFYPEVGSDKGVYFLRTLNMRKLSKQSDTYDYYTRIVPTGKKGLTIESVNDGKNYLDNFQYSDKVITYFWEDESYTDAQALKDDAELMLDSISKPVTSYSADVIDLAKQSGKYNVLSYGIGDTIKLIDVELGIREKQRIMRMTQYPDEPWKNTCELGNTVLTFEEMQQKYQEASEIINHMIDGDGRYKGTINVSDILGFEDGISGSTTISGILDGMNGIGQNLSELKLTVGTIESNYLSTEQADIKYATIKKLEATDVHIQNLEVDFGEFENLVAGKIAATDASIKNLKAEKLSAKDADLKYAKIDFANIGEAAIEKLFADSGIIKDLIVSGGHITGELVGVTIKGDLIEAGTVKADKLVVKGSDGLYYKLNVSGETVESEQTEYNSLNGSVITAKSITATKIAVDDLVAFDATIAGLHLTDGSLYSGVKESVHNSTRGFYLDKLGQMNIGDSNNYCKYYKDQNGVWRIAILADSIRFGSSGKDIEETIASAITSSEEEFYGSTSPITLAGGSWSKSQPQWTEGIYIWRRTVVTYGDGTIKYTPSENGVCITGNTGAQGEKGDDAVILQILSSNGNLFKNSSIATSLTVTIIVAGEMITSSKRMYEKFGLNATLTWYQKRFGETEFTKIEEDDNRMSDHGFILTINPQDIFAHTVFNCELNY